MVGVQRPSTRGGTRVSVSVVEKGATAATGKCLATAGQRREKGRLALHRELKDENENSHPPEHDAQALLHNHLGVMLHRIRNRLRECLEARGIDG